MRLDRIDVHRVRIPLAFVWKTPYGDQLCTATSRVPGIAQEPDPDLLARWTVEHAAFTALPGRVPAPSPSRG